MLKPLYGLDVLLRALAVLEDRGVAFEARVCGDGSERQPLQELARSLGIAHRTTFAGTVPAGRMADELAWTDVYVSTSFTDGASSSLFEAMAVGRFPVVSDLPANRPYVEQGVSGVLFPPGDSAALAAALEQAAGDPVLCRSGGLRAREIAATKLDYRCNMTAIESAILESRLPETTLPS
jgi:glycosyltransferase involved in cell wall biosynthesis